MATPAIKPRESRFRTDGDHVRQVAERIAGKGQGRKPGYSVGDRKEMSLSNSNIVAKAAFPPMLLVTLPAMRRK